MSCFYFSLPVVFGYFVVNKVIDGAEETARERLEGDKKRTIGNTTDATSSMASKVGAGGWGGGVNLATSDIKTQDINRINLERFLKKQRRLKQKQEQESAVSAK